MDVLERYLRMFSGVPDLSATLEVEQIESGNITITSAAWATIGEITFDAQAGDIVLAAPYYLSNGAGADMEGDLAVIVGGSAVKYLSSLTAVQKTNGFAGLYLDSGNTIYGPLVMIELASGDIDSGQVTLRFLGKSTGANVVLFANDTNYAAYIKALKFS